MIVRGRFRGVEVGGHRADAYCIRMDGTPGIVEFRITAKASDEKHRTYRDADLPAVEVDLRPLVGKALALEELAKYSVSEVRTRILQAASFKGWLCAQRSRMRAIKALRSVRVNFHSNGCAMPSK